MNIVLANANGIVLIADSKQTGKNPAGQVVPISRPGQKLFRIDDKTVCTIAGFGSASLPKFLEFINSAAGVIDQYTSELRSTKKVPSFHEKLTSLAFLFDHYLFGIGNLMDLTPENAGDYGFDLRLAGYDSDGTPKIGSLSLSSSFAYGRFEPVLKNVSETTIGRELVYDTAGIGGPVAKNILAYPRQFAAEREIGRYAVSMAADSGSSLSTPEMEDLARALVLHATTVYPQFIGGPDQVAILRNGGIQSIEQPTFEPREQNANHFQIDTGFTIDVQNVADAVFFRVPAGTIHLFIGMSFLNSEFPQLLDNGYFLHDKFVNATLMYDGGTIGWEDNEISNCELVLGPDADRSSPFVQELLTNYHWKHVQK